MNILGLISKDNKIEYAVVDEKLNIIRSSTLEKKGNIKDFITNLINDLSVKNIFLSSGFQKDLIEEINSNSIPIIYNQENINEQHQFWEDHEGNVVYETDPLLIWEATKILDTLSICAKGKEKKTVAKSARDNDLFSLFKLLENKLNIKDFLKFASLGLPSEALTFEIKPYDLTLEFNYSHLINDFYKYIADFKIDISEINPELSSELRTNYLQDGSYALLEAIYQTIVLQLIVVCEELAINNLAIYGDLAYDHLFRKIILKELGQEIKVLFPREDKGDFSAHNLAAIGHKKNRYNN